MADTTYIKVKARHIVRKDTANNWVGSNPILLAGEPAYIIDENNRVIGMKIGDGKTRWLNLPEFVSGMEVIGTLSDDGTELHLNSDLEAITSSDGTERIMFYSNNISIGSGSTGITINKDGTINFNSSMGKPAVVTGINTPDDDDTAAASKGYVDVSVNKTISDINNNVSNALKASASGVGEVKITDASPIEHDLTVKVSSAKNLLKYPYTDSTKTSNGLTFTDNGDGSITINGTATADTYFSLCTITFQPRVYHVLSITAETDETLFYATVKTSKWQYSETMLNAYKFNYGGSAPKDILLGIYIKSGTTISDITVYPQLELGEERTDYAPVISPDVSVTRSGKNLFDPSVLLEANGWNEEDNIYSGAAVNLRAVYHHTLGTKSLINNFKPNTQYTLSFYGRNAEDGNGLGLYFKYSDGTTGNSNDGDIRYVTTTNDTKYILTTLIDKTVVSLHATGSSTTNTYIHDIQVEENTDVTDYEPFVEPITATADNEGIVNGLTSGGLSNIYINSDNMIINVEYNKDINKLDLQGNVDLTSYATIEYVDNLFSNNNAELSSLVYGGV